MYFTLTASKDTYITNKVISNIFSASDANVGRASTLDFFKLYDESALSGVDKPIELSRALIKFDFDRINTLLSKSLNLNGSDFKCYLKLHDIMGGQMTPTNFKISLFPLSQSFDEGIGRNVTSFSDVGASNFFTASYSNSANVLWYASGANKQGNIDKTSLTGYPEEIDIIISGNLNDGDGSKSLEASQTFIKGNEDLRIDVTTIVSATVAGILPDAGWRLSFTGSEENDTKTRFVKRFASRHVRDTSIAPRLEVIYDDSIKDQQNGMFFDLSGSVFLKNFHRGVPANILSGGFANTQTEVTGNDCIVLKIQSGSFIRHVSASQHQEGTRWYNHRTNESYNFVTGVYSASFTVSSLDTGIITGSTRIIDYVKASGSLTFDAIWSSPDLTVSYLTSSLTFKRLDSTSFNMNPKRVDLIVTNAKSSYKLTEKPFFRVFVRDFAAEEKKSKLPYSLSSVILEEVYYRVRDAESGKIWIPFTKEGNGTRLSSDSEGMFFEFYMDTLAKGRTYDIDFLIKDSGIELIQEAKNVRFRVE